LNPACTTASCASGHYRLGLGWTTPLPRELNSLNSVVMAFGSARMTDDDEPIKELRAAFPDSVIVGCSTAGEIHGHLLWDDSLSVGVYKFRSTRVSAAQAPVRGPDDSYRAGIALGEQLKRPDLRAVQVFSDGLLVNGTDLVRGLTAALGPAVVISGGLAGDGTSFKQTWVMHAGRVCKGIVSAVGLAGDRLRIGHGSMGGWDSFGPDRIITRSQGNVLFELDGQPALPLYKKYLGDRAAGLPSSALLFPLTIRASRDDATSLVRTILSVDETAQSMTFAGDVAQGAVAQLMRASPDRLIAGASRSSEQALKGLGGQPALCLAVSCVGRRLVLGERTEEELEATHALLPQGSVQVGFYSYGEISPARSGVCELHNQTMTLTIVSEI